MTTRLDWERDGQGWPQRDASRFVQASGLRWLVQQAGPTNAPLLLLIHGTGAASHSWRGLMPLLALHFNTLAVDLPGHGYTSAASAAQMSLPGMARALQQLLAAALGPQAQAGPELVVGHSAGAAIAARMCLEGAMAPRGLVSLNGAFLPLGGLPGLLFPSAAKLMAALPFVPEMFASRAASPAAVQRLIEGTGSRLDAEGAALYARLLRNPGHAAGALAMMANWDLRPLERDLPRLTVPLTLLVGANDRAVPASQSRHVHRLLPASRLVTLPGLGHLAHEEQPALLAAHIVEAARTVGLPPAA